MKEVYGKSQNGLAAPGSIIQGDGYRFTVLTERMIRMEYSAENRFVDEQTQVVLNRRFPPPAFTVKESDAKLEIITKYLIVTYDKKPFSSNGLTVQMLGNPYVRKTGTWFYGDWSFVREGNLKGTAVTLDNAVGDMYYRDSADETKVWGEPDRPVELCDGILSRMGFTVIDDSKSLLFQPDGWVAPPPEGHTDLYFMCYGRNYLEALNVYFQMTGSTPLLPRYALGNWWSRYYSYTQQEYLALHDRFRAEKLPVSVAVLDMGWHNVAIDPKYGKGWTGYTWNKKLFPDPAAMLQELHARGMHVSLNVHPADGVRAHEEAYVPMAKELGVDYEKEIPIEFDVTNRKFMEAYFQYLHHPHEEIGVDFWWMDWQQGSNTRVPGYDPLWMLNHYHYIDNGRNGNRPLDFSRFAGLGSHRYPIGFSGSTFITWESLDFQPYFTATASNVGYGWWSHDIGGHRNGYREDELTTRWVQFGVFSPIMRMHSSDEVFTGKEPWKFCADSERVMRNFLSLRHQLVPYLYTMNERFHAKNLPLVQPLYYQHPEQQEAYRHPNEYYFGSALLVHPITSRMDASLRMGAVKTWLPEGLWYDLFTGACYQGGKTMELFRPIDSIPVLAKAGATIPMQAREELSSRTDNPKAMELRAFAGADGVFTMYEDDGVSMDYEQGKSVRTTYEVKWGAEKSFTVHPAVGDASLIPAVRDYTIFWYGVPKGVTPAVTVNGRAVASALQYDEEKNILTVSVAGVGVQDELKLLLPAETERAGNNVLAWAYAVINRAQLPFAIKEGVYRLLKSGNSREQVYSTVQAMYMPQERLKAALFEILFA